MPPRLKSLELHGYKTFASRTDFEFPGIITAIVGPNGSGKSNIADALRWVLGEQSYTLLRGRKTEDMIFSGSEQRPRAGMASATITFDNGDGWLPIDFSEVAITRRAYRDGQNEYLINGQRVRLREISELLAQSGLAERTYTIIGQGLVDAALALKPEERRRLFEEAAGIGLYRSRREEALSRLDSTSRNLERVQDIIAELEPRLKSLERQARRAQEYENLQSDLHILLRDWYGYHWLESQKELKRTAEIFRQQEKHLEQVRGHRTAVNEEMIDLRRKIHEARTALNIRHSQAAALHQQLEQTSRSLAILDERKRSQIDLQQSLQVDLTRLESEIEDRRNRLNQAVSDRDRLNDELADAQKQASAAKMELQARQKERLEVENTLSARRQSLIQVETRIVKQTARKNELEDRLTGTRNSLAGTVQAIQSLQNELGTLDRQIETVRAEKQAAENDQKAATRIAQEQRSAVHAMEAERHEKSVEQSRVETDTTRLKTQLDVLEQAQKSFSGVGEGAKYILETRKQGKIKGGLQSLSSLMSVPAEIETAVTAALGEYLDMVLLEQDTDPDQILEILQSSEKGRAAILPVAWVRGVHQDGLPADEEYLGIAADLVGFPAERRSIIEAALGHVFIVRSRSAARRILTNQPQSTRAVTLNGEVFLANGMVLSGRQIKGGTAQFSRPRQIQELQGELVEVEKSRKNIQSQLQNLDLELSRARENQKLLDQRLHLADSTVGKLVNQLRSLDMNREQNQRQMDWLHKQQSQGQNQISALEKEITTVEANSGVDTREVEQLKSMVHALAASLAGLPLDEHRAQAAHWDTAAAVTHRGYTQSEKRVEEIQNDLTAATKNIDSIRERIQTCSGNITYIDVDREKSYTEENRLRKEVEETAVLAAPEEEAVQKLEGELEDLQETDISTQHALTMAERHYTQAQLDAVKARESAETISRRAEEDFGLVSFAVEEAATTQQPLPLEGMVESLPAVEILPPGLEENISRIRGQIRRLGAINPESLSEFTEVQERLHSLKNQVTDLHKATDDLHQVIAELDDLMKREFRKTFDAVAVEFRQMFTRLFGGGNARLVLTDDDQPIEAGIDIEARLPGRREQGLSLLSGGERSLAAVALVFSLLRVSPTPFCVLDEVDAMLDEANVARFRDLLRELSETTQFIVITHNRNTVQAADVIYGVTMGRDSASQIISMKLEEIPQEMAQ